MTTDQPAGTRASVPPPPPLGHECCPCAGRLRDRSKTLSDEWHKRTADWLRERDWAMYTVKLGNDALSAVGRDPKVSAAIVGLLIQRLKEQAEEISSLKQEALGHRRQFRALSHKIRHLTVGEGTNREAVRAREDEALLDRETAYMRGYEAGLAGRTPAVTVTDPKEADDE